MGRPLTYDKMLADLVLERMSEGTPLRQICDANDSLPGESTIRGWAVQDIDGFAARYARAREAQMEALAEDILEISDDASRDIQTDEEGRETVDHEHIQRSKLRVDSRKWLMSKLAPKRYGDKVDVGVDGSITIQVVKLAADHPDTE
jgi:hypothetical protein